MSYKIELIYAIISAMIITEARERFGKYQRRVIFAGLLGASTILTGCEAKAANALSMPNATRTTTAQSTTGAFTFSNNGPQASEQLVFPNGESHQETGSIDIGINTGEMVSHQVLDIRINGQKNFVADFEIVKDPKDILTVHLQTCLGYFNEQNPRGCASRDIPVQDWTIRHDYRLLWVNWNIKQVAWDGKNLQIANQGK